MKTDNRVGRRGVRPRRRHARVEALGSPATDTLSIRRGDASSALSSSSTGKSAAPGEGWRADSTLPSAAESGLAAPAPGQRFGGIDRERFELLERLGGGGMSDVFLARDTVLDRNVAIKFLTDGALGTEPALRRIQQEAQACARLNHENIVRLFDMGTDRGLPFLVMEHLEGASLDALVRRDGRMDTHGAVRILIDVAKGLSQAHRAGIVHRDLKPSNVFITKGGAVKILDFGVARMTEQPAALDGGLSGTPQYMSPEQWKGEAQDCRTDIWSAGIMLFELLTGERPFHGAALEELRRLIVSTEPAPSLTQERPDLPEEAERVVQRALAKEPSERFGTADELLDALVALELSLAPAARAPRRSTVSPRPERRQTTVLSCSFHDSLELPGETGLDELGESFADGFEICATTIRELEGTLVSSLGPRIVACFGYPVAHEDSAPRAVRAALRIVAAFQRRARRGGAGTVRIGIATSHALVTHSDIASAPFMLQGDALHVAHWLEQRAGENAILIGRATQTLVRGQFDLEPLGEATPEGAQSPMALFRVLRPKDVASRFDPVAAGGALTPFVGRARELEVLRGLWNDAKDGHGRCVQIAGEAGIGKSRLLERFLQSVAAADADEEARSTDDLPIVVRCQCWPHFQNSALQPIIEGLARQLGLRALDPEGDHLALLEQALTEIDPALREHAPLLCAFCGLRNEDGEPPPSLGPDAFRRRLLDALLAIFSGLASGRPTIVIVEDAHWSDGATLELLNVLCTKAATARMLVIVTARTELHAPWQVPRLELTRLSADETAWLIASVALSSEGRHLPRPVVERLVQRADGVPLFVEELTHWVVEALGAMEPGHGSMALDAFVSHAIPATLEGLLRARLDALPQDGRDVAHLIAVLGRDVPFELVRATSELDEEALRVGLRQLLEAGILRQQGDGSEVRYTFGHALVKEAAYQSLVKTKRQHLHRRAAEVLLERFRDFVEQHAELLAGHFMEAGCHERAVGYFEMAGQRALQRAMNADAVAHFERALAELRMLPKSTWRDDRELELLIPIRAAHVFAGNLTGVPADFTQRFATHANGSIDPAKKLLAHVAFAASSLMAGNLTTSCEQGLSALALCHAGEREDPAPTFEGLDPVAVSSLGLVWAFGLLGESERALEHARAMLRRSQRHGHPPSQVVALARLAAWYNHRGDFDEGRRLVDQMAPLCARDGFEGPRAMTKIVRGWARVAKGDGGGVAEIEEGMVDRRKFGGEGCLTLCCAVLAWARWHEGALDEAIRALDEAMDLVEHRGERFFEPELHRLRGEVLFAQGADMSRVAECFERGLTVAREQKARTWEQRLEESYARIRPSGEALRVTGEVLPIGEPRQKCG
ncbi:protein kinase domain-containing protein [Pendulispora albinea]|uniref:Protein kinase n=1 Tax=Pendulispora albinea TaxID=2741071 RepID=A0ABZ2M8M4_9BACT